MLNKRKPTEKSASAADAFLNYKTVKTDLTKPLGQTLRWALLPVSAEGFLPLLAACSISTSSPQSSPPVSNYTAKSTPRLTPPFFLFFFFFIFFSFPQQENAYWKWLVFVVPFKSLLREGTGEQCDATF